MPKSLTMPKRLWTEEDCRGMALSVWLARIGRGKTTGWKWRRLGWIETVTIAGQPYIESAQIRRFWARAKSGEFAENKKIERAAA